MEKDSGEPEPKKAKETNEKQGLNKQQLEMRIRQWFAETFEIKEGSRITIREIMEMTTMINKSGHLDFMLPISAAQIGRYLNAVMLKEFPRVKCTMVRNDNETSGKRVRYYKDLAVKVQQAVTPLCLGSMTFHIKSILPNGWLCENCKDEINFLKITNLYINGERKLLQLSMHLDENVFREMSILFNGIQRTFDQVGLKNPKTVEELRSLLFLCNTLPLCVGPKLEDPNIIAHAESAYKSGKPDLDMFTVGHPKKELSHHIGSKSCEIFATIKKGPCYSCSTVKHNILARYSRSKRGSSDKQLSSSKFTSFKYLSKEQICMRYKELSKKYKNLSSVLKNREELLMNGNFLIEKGSDEESDDSEEEDSDQEAEGNDKSGEDGDEDESEEEGEEEEGEEEEDI